MSEELQEMEQQVINPDIDYIETIKKLKSNSVSKEDYEKLQTRNRQLLESLANGQKEQEEEKKVEHIPSGEARKNLFEAEDLNNLEWWKRFIQLRQSVMEEGGHDPCVADNRNVTGTQFDYETSEKVINVVQECIDYSQGDSEAFTNELMRRTNDVVIPRGVR